MVVVKLQGGLGNQMFQYACGKAFALKHDQPLWVYPGFINNNQVKTDEFTPRQYQLDVFDMEVNLAGEETMKKFITGSAGKKVRKLLKLPYHRCYTEAPDQGAAQLTTLAPPVLLDGYWQSEQYFFDHKRQIRKGFKFKARITAGLKELVERMAGSDSVSIHFRRGDYVTNAVARKVLGPLNADYYKAAINKIESLVKAPYYFIFSDDPSWVKANLPPIANYEIVEHAAGRSEIDMLLMSHCSHNIIANSSFSWWAAWLNNNSNKIVIAPERWFADPDFNKNAARLVPEEWLRL